MENRIGKIESVKFGHVGYNDAELGIQFTFSSKKDSWGVGWSKAYWDSEIIKHNKNTQWTEAERDNAFAGVMKYISKLLKQAKVSDFTQLKNIPVEVTFEGNCLKDWRILEEVL